MKLLNTTDWIIRGISDEKLVSAAGYLSQKEAEGMEYFKQALMDGEVIVIHTFPQRKRRTATRDSRDGASKRAAGMRRIRKG